jgi:hypothetical protein
MTSPAIRGSGEMLVKLSLDELCRRADYIIVGQISEMSAQQDGNGHTYTLVSLSAERIIKGEVAQTLVVRVPGGQVNGRTLEVEDSPNFRQGERVVLFLEKTDGDSSVEGGFQGKFTIDDGDRVGGVSLEQFIEQIRNAVANRQGGES